MTDVHTTRHTVVVPNSIDMVSLLGPADEHLAQLEEALEADLHVRGNKITLIGEPSELALAERLLDELVTILRTGQPVTGETVERVLGMLRAETSERPADVLSLNILSNRGRSIRPKTLNQKRYVDSIDEHTITFGIGPAGTGKTYLAMAKAVQALQGKQVNRIILTRPAVEAGEHLGFLPGTLGEKIDPYLRPLYDALHDMMDPDSIPKLMAAGTIEVAPLAYMRGRTLNDSFIILDEAQNTTPEQMKMFLTRIGFGSKVVVTGDQVARGKPHPEPYLTAAAALGVRAEDCVAIEDSATGALSAEAAGCVVLVVQHHVPVPEGPRRVFRDSLAGLTVEELRRLSSP